MNPKRTMTSKQRLLAAIHHEEPDLVPNCPRIWAYQMEQYGCIGWLQDLRSADEFDYDPIVCIPSFLPTYLKADDLKLRRAPESMVELDVQMRKSGESLRVTRRFLTPAGPLQDVTEYYPSGKTYGMLPSPHFVERLLKGPEDLERMKYLFFNPKDINIDEYHRIAEVIGDRGLLEVALYSALDYKAGDAFGLEPLLMMTVDQPEFFKKILDVFHDHTMEETKAHLEGGVKMVFGTWFYASLSSGWSPNIYREYFLPLLKEHVNLVHDYEAIYHLYDDGKCRNILPLFAEAGVDIVETLTPPPVGDIDLAEAKQMIGDRVCLKGNIDIVYVIKNGTPDMVRSSVRKAIEDAASGGGFILSTSDSIRDASPRENVLAYFQTARESGVYKHL